MVPGSPPTAPPERLRVQLKHFGTFVRYLNVVQGALVGSVDHSRGQIWRRKMVSLVPGNELSKIQSYTRHSLLKFNIGVRPTNFPSA